VELTAAYDAAAELFDAPPLSYWAYFGERLVERAGLRAGEIVLDVCSGSGASALPAAQAVGAGGRVIGLDLSSGMIALARAKAAAASLPNLEFRQADFDQAYFRNASFDAVLCGFGLCFFPDMRTTLQKMWRLLRPGGRLAITSWGEDSFEPGHTIFWNAVREVRPDLYKETHNRDRLSSPELVRAVFEQAGIPAVAVAHEKRDQPLDSPEDWWTIVMGSGYRGVVEHLTEPERREVRSACAAITGPIQIPALYALAAK
jgi:ubiquinone/menaquinone biosynthesis C-methylase UbiE